MYIYVTHIEDRECSQAFRLTAGAPPQENVPERLHAVGMAAIVVLLAYMKCSTLTLNPYSIVLYTDTVKYAECLRGDVLSRTAAARGHSSEGRAQ